MYIIYSPTTTMATNSNNHGNNNNPAYINNDDNNNSNNNTNTNNNVDDNNNTNNPGYIRQQCADIVEIFMVLQCIHIWWFTRALPGSDVITSFY